MVESALRIIIVMPTGESQRLLFLPPARISLYGLEVIVVRFVVLRSGSTVSRYGLIVSRYSLIVPQHGFMLLRYDLIVESVAIGLEAQK